MMIQAGELTERLELQALRETNTHGEATQTYYTVDTVWGRVIAERGQEAFEAARTTAKAQIRVQIRYRDDVDTTWRVRWFGQAYGISYVDRSARADGALWLTAQVVGAV